MTNVEQIGLLVRAVELRRRARRVRERARRELARAEDAILGRAGVQVSLSVAAAVLGVRVSEFEDHVRSGTIPASRPAGASDGSFIDSRLLVDLAAELEPGAPARLVDAIEALRVRRRRDADVIDADALITAVHEIAAGRRRAAP